MAQQLRIVIADDESLIRMNLKETLVGMNYLVVGEAGVLGLLALPDGVALVALGGPGGEVDRARADLGGHVGVRHEVHVPDRVRVGAGLRGEHGEAALAQVLVHDGVDPLVAGLGPGRVQEQQGRPGEVAADLTVVRPELLDDLGVPALHRVVVHRLGSSWCEWVV